MHQTLSFSIEKTLGEHETSPNYSSLMRVNYELRELLIASSDTHAICATLHLSRRHFLARFSSIVL